MPEMAQRIQRAADKIDAGWEQKLSGIKSRLVKKIDGLRSEIIGSLRASLGVAAEDGELKDTEKAATVIERSRDEVKSTVVEWVRSLTGQLAVEAGEGIELASDWAAKYAGILGIEAAVLDDVDAERLVGALITGAQADMIEEARTFGVQVVGRTERAVLLEQPKKSAMRSIAAAAGLGAIPDIGVGAVHNAFRISTVMANERLPRRRRPRRYIHEGPIHRHNHPVSLRWLGEVMSKEDWESHFSGWPVLHVHEHGWMRPVAREEISADPKLRDAADRRIRYFGDRSDKTGISMREQKLALRIVQEKARMQRLGPTILRGPRKGQLRAKPADPTPWERRQSKALLRVSHGQGLSRGFERGMIYPSPGLSKRQVRHLVESLEAGGPRLAELREFVGSKTVVELR